MLLGKFKLSLPTNKINLSEHSRKSFFYGKHKSVSDFLAHLLLY